MFNYLRKKENLQLEEVVHLFEESRPEVLIPLNIFCRGIPPGEALCKYLKDKENLSYKEIGELLGKSVNTIWATYQHACKRKIVSRSENKYFLPISLFQNRSLSLMETIVLHLNQIYHLKNKEIASLLHTSHSSVAVLMKRAKDKNVH